MSRNGNLLTAAIKDKDSFEFNRILSKEDRKRRNRISELLKTANEFNNKTDKNPNVDRRELRREFRKRTEDLFK